MSYFKATCPRCGEEYMTGVVGKKLMGYHLCRDTSKVCSLHGKGKAAVSVFPRYAANREEEG